MFEQDENVIKANEEILKDLTKACNKKEQEECESWKPFLSLLLKLRQIKDVHCSTNFNIISWLIFENDEFVILYDGSYHKIFKKTFYKKLFKSLIGCKPEVSIYAPFKEIFSVSIDDYSRTGMYEALFQEMNEEYIRLLKETAYNKQVNMEFKKLVNFA
ncbi:MAG: hypothetical protein HGA35_02300 [Erysipelotrichaceae bacterium]|nr:hypothetical protein [Erysipelotrichaceae bacterium]